MNKEKVKDDTKTVDYEYGSEHAFKLYTAFRHMLQTVVKVDNIEYLITDLVWLADNDQWAFVGWEYPHFVRAPMRPVMFSHTIFMDGESVVHLSSAGADIPPYFRNSDKANDRYAELKQATEGQIYFHAKGGANGAYRPLSVVWSLDFQQWALTYVRVPGDTSYRQEMNIITFARSERNFFGNYKDTGFPRFSLLDPSSR